MFIRALKEQDIKFVREILSQGAPFVSSYNDYIYWMLGKYFPSTCLVAETNGQILGYIGALLSAEKRKIFVWQIAVKPEERGQQIGRKLLEQIVTVAREMGVDVLEIAINDENISCHRMVKKLAQHFDSPMTEEETYKDGNFSETVFRILV